MRALLGDALRKLEEAARIAEAAEAPGGFSGSLTTATELLRYAQKQAGEIVAVKRITEEPPCIVEDACSVAASDSPMNDNLADLLPQILSPAGVEWEVFGEPEVACLSSEVQRAILDILREVLVNTARHAQANRVTLHYFHSESCFRMRVADDGKGFCLHHPRKSLGLARIRERAEFLGGELKVESAPSAGTRVVFTMPIIVSEIREDIPA